MKVIMREVCLSVLFASALLTTCSCSRPSEQVEHTKEFTFLDIRSRARMTMDENWSTMKIDIDDEWWRSAFIFRFISDDDRLLAVWTTFEDSEQVYGALTGVGMQPVDQWDAQNDQFNTVVHEFKDNFVAVSEPILCGDVYIHVLFESNFHASQSEIRDYVDSFSITCDLDSVIETTELEP